MKIAVISAQVFACPPAGYSGLEMIAWQCARGLAARGHEVALVAPDGSSCPGCEIVPTGPPGRWDEKRAYSKYWQELPRFDAVIDHSWNKWAYSLKKEGRLKAPVLAVMHAPVNTMIQSPPPVEKPCVVCISKDQAAHFSALFGRPARVAYNGVDLDFYRPTGVPRSGRFLFLARFSTIKGPHLAIEACRRAGVGLDLVGDTSITNEPEYLAKVKGMCDGAYSLWEQDKVHSYHNTRILMRGPASRGECVHWFSQAHALIHPNRDYREPFGLAPVEAMACGCPVIAWDNGAMRETLGPNEGGIVVRSEDELAFWVQDWAASKVGLAPDGNFRKRCREWAGRFSVGRMVERYEELCVEAVDTGGW